MSRRYYRPTESGRTRDDGYAALAAAMVEIAVRDATGRPSPRTRSNLSADSRRTRREAARQEAVHWLTGRLAGQVSIHHCLDLLCMDHDALMGRMRSRGILA